MAPRTYTRSARERGSGLHRWTTPLALLDRAIPCYSKQAVSYLFLIDQHLIVSSQLLAATMNLPGPPHLLTLPTDLTERCFSFLPHAAHLFTLRRACRSSRDLVDGSLLLWRLARFWGLDRTDASMRPALLKAASHKNAEALGSMSSRTIKMFKFNSVDTLF